MQFDLESKMLKETPTTGNPSGTPFITLTVMGRKEDHGDVRLDDFINQLQLVKDALAATDRAVHDGKETVYYRVCDLTHNSPATVTVEIVPIPDPYLRVDSMLATKVKEAFSHNLKIVAGGTDEAGDLSFPVLNSLRKLTAPLDSKKVEQVRIGIDEQSLIDVTPRIALNATFLIGNKHKTLGSVSGFVEKLNIHDRNSFTIYPAGVQPKVMCRFRKKDRQHVLAAVGQYVTVRGLLWHHRGEKFPFFLDVRSIEVHDRMDELPRLSEMAGNTPGLTGDKSAVDYLEDIRSEWG